MKNVLFVGKSKSNTSIGDFLISNHSVTNGPMSVVAYLSEEGEIYTLPYPGTGEVRVPEPLNEHVMFDLVVVALDPAVDLQDTYAASQRVLSRLIPLGRFVSDGGYLLTYLGTSYESIIAAGYGALGATAPFEIVTNEVGPRIHIEPSSSRNIDCVNPVMMGRNAKEEPVFMHHTPYSVYCVLAAHMFSLFGKPADIHVVEQAFNGLRERVQPDCSMLSDPKLHVIYPNNQVSLTAPWYSDGMEGHKKLFSNMRNAKAVDQAAVRTTGESEGWLQRYPVTEAMLSDWIMSSVNTPSSNQRDYLRMAVGLQKASNDIKLIAESIKECFVGSLMNPREIVDKSAVIDNWYARDQFQMDAEITYQGPEGARRFLEVMVMGALHPAVFTEVMHPLDGYYTVLIEFKFPGPTLSKSTA
jgi:hypothetical protein